MGITAQDVLTEAVARYGDDWTPQNLADTYESMQAIAERRKTGVYYTPQPVADFMTRFAFEVAFRQIGPTAADILRIVALDPACGTGPFLVSGARFLATQYAGRLFGGDPTLEMVDAVLPMVILTCVFGVDIDPVATELSRICVARETDGVLTPEHLERHIVAGDTLKDEMPPALVERWPSVPMRPGRAVVDAVRSL
jgi:hypothetical protein